MAHPEQCLNSAKHCLNKKHADEKEKLPFIKDLQGFSSVTSNYMKLHSTITGETGNTKQASCININQRHELAEGLHDKGEHLSWAQTSAYTDFARRCSDSITYVDQL